MLPLLLKVISLQMLIYLIMQPCWMLTVPFVWWSIVEKDLIYLSLVLWSTPSLMINIVSHMIWSLLKSFTFSLAFASLANHWCFHLITFQSARYKRLDRMSCSNTVAPGEELKMMWGMEQAQAAFMMNCSISMTSRLFLTSNSATQRILPNTPCRHSNIVFASGFFTVVGLCSMSHWLQSVAKCNMNSLPLL